jgi:signal transduction histidine kinase
MFSAPNSRFRQAFALRLGLWYVALFAVSAVALLATTYLLLARSLAARDHEVLESTIQRYVGEFTDGGLVDLEREIEADAAAGRHDRLLVRVVGRAAEVVYFAAPPGWSEFDLSSLDRPSPSGWTNIPNSLDGSVLEVGTVHLGGGLTVQVGRSSHVRDELLRHFRSQLVVVFLLITVIAAAGGGLLTYVGLAPLRALERGLRAIMVTRRFDSRVDARGTHDALDELAGLVNALLGRVQTLISAMHQALDNVAHDLRTPLTRFRNVAEQALVAGDPRSAQEALERAVEEAERMGSTLTTLMDISEAETGTMQLAIEVLPLADIVEEAIDLYADAADQKGLELRSHVDPAMTLAADRTRLRQVLANLIDNAVKYTDTGGRIDVDAVDADGFVTTSVRDTGIGLSPEALPLVWERLYRADASRATRGLGLGLSLVKAVVEGHGGKVHVASTPGVGSVFSVSFPRTAATAPPAGD